MASPENVFKDKLCKEFRRILQPCLVLKHNDSLNIGLPDVQLIKKNSSVFFEIKYVGKDYKDIKGKILKHEFSPKQILFANKLYRDAEISCFGVVGFKSSEILFIPHFALKNNYTKSEIEEDLICSDISELLDEISILFM